MALDTRDKRASAIHPTLPFRGLLPVPDAAAEDAGDRQQLLLLYRGILATVAAAPTVFGDLTTLFSHYAWNTLRDASPTALDTNTLVRDDLVNVVSGTTERADRNTQYAEYLS